MATPSSGRHSDINAPSSNVTHATVEDLARHAAHALNVRGAGKRRLSVAQQLFTQSFEFDFFQAVRLLERMQPDRNPVGRVHPPETEIARFRARLSFEFPPSAIYELVPPSEDMPNPTMIVAFMGLTGPSGVLPRSYTELLFQIQRDAKHGEKLALRDWLDLFNHRMISLFFRAWEKYRFTIPYERGEYAQKEPDIFTQALYSQVGMGMPSLRGRLRVDAKLPNEKPEKLAAVDDLVLLRYGGFFARQPRCAVSLQVLLRQYFQVDVRVDQFQGQWLQLEPSGQSSVGAGGNNNFMGMNAVIGDRIWDVQSKIRIVVGPVTYEKFQDFLPDRSRDRQRKALYLLAHLTRLYVGPEFDVDVQFIIKAPTVPMCRMDTNAGPLGSRIGWNTWSRSRLLPKDADEPVFKTPEDVTIHIVSQDPRDIPQEP